MKQLIRKSIIILCVVFSIILHTNAQSSYTMAVGEVKTLYVNAYPSYNHYVSSYRWSFPGIGVTCVGGGSSFDSSCKIQAISATTNVAGGRVIVRCSWYQKENGSTIETFGGDEFFYITVNETSSSGGEQGPKIEVIKSSPSDGDINVALDVNFNLVFNQAVTFNRSSTVSQWSRLESSDGNRIYFDSHFKNVIHSDGTSGGEAVFTPQKLLQPNTRYTFVLPVGSIVGGKSGIPNTDEYRFCFTTKSEEGSATSIVGNGFGVITKSSMYNIEGRKLKSLQKGVVLVNGKKFIIK